MSSTTNKWQNDIFKENFDHFKMSKLAIRLEKKYTPRPYYVRYGLFKKVAHLASYCFNIFSLITASTMVYFFVMKITGLDWVAGIATLSFLGLLEFSKRLFAQAVFFDWITKNRFNIFMTTLTVILTSLSITFSYQGSKQLVITYSKPVATVSADSLIQPIENRISTLTQQLDAARNTKTRRGTTTLSSQRTIEALTKVIAELESERLLINRGVQEENQRLQAVHNARTYVSAQHFALFTLCCELCFMICAWYLEYYDFRSYIEFQGDTPENPSLVTKRTRVVNSKKTDKEAGLPRKRNVSVQKKITESIPNSKQQDIKKIKSQIATARYRLKNGIGKEETARKNLKKYEQLLKN
ncbi:MAG: hypothetical protein AAFZ15_31275 [Bacteroidota bacterium]